MKPPLLLPERYALEVLADDTLQFDEVPYSRPDPDEDDNDLDASDLDDSAAEDSDSEPAPQRPVLTPIERRRLGLGIRGLADADDDVAEVAADETDWLDDPDAE